MIGFGTMVNAAAVIVGGVLGLFLKGGLRQRFQDILMQALGLATVFIGVSGALKGMLVLENGIITTTGTMMMVLSLVLGALLGEWIDLDSATERFAGWLKRRTKAENDSYFIDGFVATSLTICVGAMAIVGSLEDGLTGNASMLYTKAILDGIITLIFASAYGKGAIFAVLPLVALQGSITAFAQLLQPILTEQTIANFSFVGSMLIFCVGCNLLFKTRIKVANLLPALLMVIVCGFFPL
ncbi:MAG: DUF554 domain-containing protein [Negativicutes bacterium]|nr:DUF554 domain-containing protein [Negativicutes bacterium]